MGELRTEADLLRMLGTGTYSLTELYRRAEAAGLADRPGGRKRIQDGKEQYKRRVRSALQTLRRQGRAQRVGDGEAAWLIEGTTQTPRRSLFVWLPGDPSQLEFVLGHAGEVLARCDEPIDLIVADPPYALGRGDRRSAYRRTYARNHNQVIDGYVDVDPAEYADFTANWVTAAAAALRPGGYLAVVTGAQQSARVQITGEAAGLTYVNSIVVPRPFGLYCTRRFVHQHHRITLLTAGRLDSARRVFHRPPEMPRGRHGEVYAVDVWADIPQEQRRGLLRYDNALHPDLPSRLIRSTTNPGDLVADPFLGSGATAVACLSTGRRFYGGDLNPHSLRFAMGRILAEVVPAIAATQGRATHADPTACRQLSLTDLLEESA